MAQQWYCRSKDTEIGPISARDLRRLARIGKINPQTEVRLEAGGNWVVAGLVPGLFAAGKPRKKSDPPPARQNPAAAALAALAEQSVESAMLENFDPEAVVARHQAQDIDRPQELPEEFGDDPAERLDIPLQLGDGVPPIQIAAPPLATTGAVPADRVKRLQRQINVLCVLAGFFSFLAVAVYPIPALPILVGLLAVTLALRAAGKVDPRSGVGYGLPAVSTVLSVFAIGVGIYTTFFYHDGLTGLQSRIRPAADRPPTEVAQTAADPTVKPERRWQSALSGPLHASDVELEITSAEIGPLEHGDGPAAERLRAELGEQALFVTLRLRNTSQHRKLDYTSWSGAGGGSVMPSLSDNFDNRYQRVRLRGSLPGVSQIGKSAIYPGKQIEDMLIFQAPVASASELRLSLPLLAVGGQGEFRIEIPRRMLGQRAVGLALGEQARPPQGDATEAAPPPETALLEFPPNTRPSGERDRVTNPGDANLDRLAQQEPDFTGPAVDIPQPGAALRDKPAAVEVNEKEIVDDGKFVASPFGNAADNAPLPQNKPRPAADVVPPIAGHGVIDPVLPLHGSGIARPELVTEADLAPPRDDPFRKLAD